ncbi:hypothetical protein [Salipiger mucosus]|uniref:hypothetical protein n=1 Tax=Salipiger mucosus TaxID=263378 RepID=UPI0012EB9BE3|nr:hypothetical protein [Salipiger mucosus]
MQDRTRDEIQNEIDRLTHFRKVSVSLVVVALFTAGASAYSALAAGSEDPASWESAAACLLSICAGIHGAKWAARAGRKRETLQARKTDMQTASPEKSGSPTSTFSYASVTIQGGGIRSATKSG